MKKCRCDFVNKIKKNFLLSSECSKVFCIPNMIWDFRYGFGEGGFCSKVSCIPDSICTHCLHALKLRNLLYTYIPTSRRRSPQLLGPRPHSMFSLPASSGSWRVRFFRSTRHEPEDAGASHHETKTHPIMKRRHNGNASPKAQRRRGAPSPSAADPVAVAAVVVPPLPPPRGPVVKPNLDGSYLTENQRDRLRESYTFASSGSWRARRASWLVARSCQLHIMGVLIFLCVDQQVVHAWNGGLLAPDSPAEEVRRLLALKKEAATEAESFYQHGSAARRGISDVLGAGMSTWATGTVPAIVSTGRSVLTDVYRKVSHYHSNESEMYNAKYDALVAVMNKGRARAR